MLVYISALGINYVRFPNYMYIDEKFNEKCGKKLTFSTKRTLKVSFNRKSFSEKRGRVLNKK